MTVVTDSVLPMPGIFELSSSTARTARVTAILTRKTLS